MRWEPHPAAFVTIISAPEAAKARSAASGQLETLLAAARVERERAAAAVERRGDLVTVGGEHAGRGAVHLAEEHGLDAAGQ